MKLSVLNLIEIKFYDIKKITQKRIVVHIICTQYEVVDLFKI